MKNLISIVTCLVWVLWSAAAADYPQAGIANERIHAKLYLPDAITGFYRSTRFDWSGVIADLNFDGNHYYGPWFTKFDPAVRDFSYKDDDIVVGAVSAMVGPAEEFQKPVGYDAAKPGQTFLKIGVGMLRKPDDGPYVQFKHYDLVNPGKWTVQKGAAFVKFVQELSDPASGYRYTYTKTVRLTQGKPEMTIEHTLKNLGRLPIRSNVYDHNFLVLDQTPPGPDFEITLPFDIKTTRPLNPEFAEIHKNRIAYVKTLTNQERVAFPIEGFGSDPKDYDIRIENRKLGAGMRITGDRPLASESLWSIRSVLALEPFIDVAAEPASSSPGSTLTLITPCPKRIDGESSSVADGFQYVAIGLTGEPVPPTTRSGAAVSRKVHRFRAIAALASSSRSHWSDIGVPIAASTNWRIGKVTSALFEGSASDAASPPRIAMSRCLDYRAQTAGRPAEWAEISQDDCPCA